MILVYTIPKWAEAGLWGLVSGAALVMGAFIAYFLRVSAKWIAGIMSFGSGVLISALAFNLMDEAYHRGGFDASVIGFISGAVIYSIGNRIVSRHGGKHRKRSGSQQAKENEKPGSGLAIALGALLDGIPESIAIGVSMIEGGAVSFATVIAIFISNIPEGLSSTSGMMKSGRSKFYIFGVWLALILLFGLSSWAGYAIFSQFSSNVIAATIALAGGAILTMIANTMMPEAFEEEHDWAGLITVAGFVLAFIISKIG